MATKKNEKAKIIAYWVTTVLGPASFVVGGVLHLTRAQQAIDGVQHVGYPVYLLSILGFWKLAGAIVSVLPRLPLLKEWVYAGFFFNLSGAAASHFFVGDPFFDGGSAQIASPLIFLVLVMASWALRPASRRLPGTDIFGVNAARK